jgi:uncharacterized protein (TIGR03083 family)
VTKWRAPAHDLRDGVGRTDGHQGQSVPIDWLAMAVDRADYLAAISEHCQGLAVSADGNLTGAVRGCPGWSVEDLVAHLIEVHWFWSTIVEERLSQPPDDSRRPVRARSDALIESFLKGAQRLVTVLGAAGWHESVWTWAPAQQDVGFVVRHQVQEAAIHHWDALSAEGKSLEIDPAIAADSVDEFLTFSVSSEADPADPPRPPLDGALVLKCTDWPDAWTLVDGPKPGTVRVARGAAPGQPALQGTASDLLLWLYRRVDLDPGDVPVDLLSRLRALCYTD